MILCFQSPFPFPFRLTALRLIRAPQSVSPPRLIERLGANTSSRRRLSESRTRLRAGRQILQFAPFFEKKWQEDPVNWIPLKKCCYHLKRAVGNWELCSWFLQCFCSSAE